MGKTAALLPTWPKATCDWMEMTECLLNALFPDWNNHLARKTGARLSRHVEIGRFAFTIIGGVETRAGRGR
jgi:hypothetical protein